MSEKGFMATYAPYLSLGLEIAVGVSLPILGGYWMDQYLGTTPWLIILGCILGVVNVFLIIFRLNDKLNADSEQ